MVVCPRFLGINSLLGFGCLVEASALNAMPHLHDRIDKGNVKGGTHWVPHGLKIKVFQDLQNITFDLLLKRRRFQKVQIDSFG